MIQEIVVWWHHQVLHHQQTVATGLTVSLFDPSAKGRLVRCSCNKAWAK